MKKIIYLLIHILHSFSKWLKKEILIGVKKGSYAYKFVIMFLSFSDEFSCYNYLPPCILIVIDKYSFVEYDMMIFIFTDFYIYNLIDFFS